MDPLVLERLLTVGPQEHIIRPDDTLAIVAYGVHDFNFRERVSSTGLISLPLIGLVPVAGLSPQGAAAAIAQQLSAKGMVLDPQVDVTFYAEPSEAVTVTGEVNKPGSFPVAGNVTLGAALGLAAGLKETASPVVTLLRRGEPGPIAIPVALGSGFSRYTAIPLLAGDHLVVSKVGQFYVTGAVAKQGAVLLKNSTPTTVLEALSLAGGAGFQADLGDSAIVRNAPGGPVVIPVNLKKLPRAGQGNITLQPDDVLFIPTSAMKAAIKAGGTGIVIALSNFGSYLGSRRN